MFPGLHSFVRKICKRSPSSSPPPSTLPLSTTVVRTLRSNPKSPRDANQPGSHRWVFLAILCLGLGSASAYAADTVFVEKVCEATTVAPSAGEDGTPPILLNRQKAGGPLFRLETRTDEKGGIVGARSVPVSVDEAKRLCDAGFPVSVVDSTGVARAVSGQKTAVEPLSSLQSSFSIVGLYDVTWGNFWVPGAMPSGHTYQVVDFTVDPYNYSTTGASSHFGVSTLTVSNSNLDQDFDGKGAYFAASDPFCGTVLESWAIQGYSDATGTCSNPANCLAVVFRGSAPAPWNLEPNSCNYWSATAKKRFLVGANTSQLSRYWHCVPGGACPVVVSPDVNSTTPYFRAGGAGVAFLQVGASYSSSVWYLTFSNVISYTGP